MTIQAIYHNTGLTPDDVIDEYAHGKLRTFDVRPRRDNVHIMLYPKQHPDVKIQILRFAANVWGPGFDELDEIEDLLNEMFGDSFNPKPFKERNIIRNIGECQKILETPLGLISAFAYYFPSVITDAVHQAVQSMDNSDNWVRHL